VLLLQRITEMLAVELALPRFDDGGSVYCNVFFYKSKINPILFVTVKGPHCFILIVVFFIPRVRKIKLS
jgi:hypothetical protein